jgi:transcriptional regulator with XRE-family HTH domain
MKGGKRMTVGERLKDLRGERPQTIVAKEIGISRSALIKYENDERLPRPEIMVKIAKYYKKSVNNIFFS